ncbi:hypothetical protein DY000_02009892 [Brassica cretica]|uniref:PRA1 family protein n=1 Tax=Brassica cretica TaxID=69181 RepID=A0ABQ7CAU3_BRACR|nr:hypothetical protein DY000_02009892 [Brassica cretica]
MPSSSIEKFGQAWGPLTLQSDPCNLSQISDRSNVVACFTLLILALPVPSVVLSLASLSSVSLLVGYFSCYPSKPIQFD